MIKKIILGSIFLAIFGFLFNFGAPTAKAMTATEIQTLIQQLQAQIVALQQQLTATQGTTAVWCHDFNVNLKYGDTGTEVEALQTALEKEGFDCGKDALTNSFGDYTASAMVGFQEKYKDDILTPWGLAHGTGFVGKTTRVKLNKLYGCGLVCAQVVTYAQDPVTGKCQSFPTPCDVPSGWQKVSSCPTTPSITVISPNGGEQWAAGSVQTITWTSNLPASQNINIVSLKDSKVGTEYHLLYNIQNDGSEKITVPSLPGKTFYLHIETIVNNQSVSDDSDKYFTISNTNVSIAIVSPNGGETLKEGDNFIIGWKSSGLPVDAKVFLTLFRYETATANDGPNISIVGNIPASQNYYNWKVSTEGSWGYGYLKDSKRIYAVLTSDQNLTSNYRYKVFISVSGAGLDVWDFSDNYFSIVAATTTPSITVLSPNGGETWQIGNTYQVKWTSNNLPTEAQNKIGISAVPEGSSTGISIFNNITNDGNENWTIPSTLSPGKYKIIVGCYLPEQGCYSDYSDNYFSIVAATAACTDSDGGQNYYVKGTCTDGAGISRTDICLCDMEMYKTSCSIDPAFKNKLNEYSCDPLSSGGLSCRNDIYTCPAGCKDGACIQATTTATTTLNTMENQMADISSAVSSLAEQIKKLLGR